MADTSRQSPHVFHNADESVVDPGAFPAQSHPYAQYSQTAGLPEAQASNEQTVPRHSAMSPYTGSGDRRPDGYQDRLPAYSQQPHGGEITLDRQAQTQRSQPASSRRLTSHAAAGQSTANRDVTSERPPGYFQAVAAKLAARNAHAAAGRVDRNVASTRPPSYFQTFAARLAARNAQVAVSSPSTRSSASIASASPAAVAAARHASNTASDVRGIRRLNGIPEGRAAPEIQQQEKSEEDSIRELNDRSQDRSRLRGR